MATMATTTTMMMTEEGCRSWAAPEERVPEVLDRRRASRLSCRCRWREPRVSRGPVHRSSRWSARERAADARRAQIAAPVCVRVRVRVCVCVSERVRTSSTVTSRAAHLWPSSNVVRRVDRDAAVAVAAAAASASASASASSRAIDLAPCAGDRRRESARGSQTR